MQTILTIGLLIAAYLLGSLPSGLIIVKVGTGKDVREVGSGRTGGTNAMRAAGFLAGALTGIADFAKGALAVLLVRFFLPGDPWVEVFAGALAVLGHNYSIFLPERDEQGRLHLRGGAGGAACLGGAFGIWHPAFLFIFPLSGLVYGLIGYASVATISIAFFATLVFAVRALLGFDTWIYVVYGVISLALVLWALRPNLRRLREGTERPVGLRAYQMKKQGKEIPWGEKNH